MLALIDRFRRYVGGLCGLGDSFHGLQVDNTIMASAQQLSEAINQLNKKVQDAEKSSVRCNFIDKFYSFDSRVAVLAINFVSSSTVVERSTPS